MESFLNAAVLMESALLSFLLALGVVWLGLRGLFQLMPGGKLETVPIRFMSRRVDVRAR